MNIGKPGLAALIPFYFAFCLRLGAAPLYVATNGPSTPPYDTWAKAATNIEWAVSAGVNGDTVWISNGTYYLTNQVTVRSNITVIGTGGVVVVDGNNANRCFEFTSAATGGLANITITRGYANGDGGGVYMRYGTVRDCIFSNNIATNRGGGMILVGGTNTAQRCAFIANKAMSGGGIYLIATLNSLVDHCSFQTNIAFANGGGIYCSYNLGYTIITGCDFICNVATNIGGGVTTYSSVDTNMISHCTFASNIAVTNLGGGMWLYGSGCLVSNCYVSNNVATNGGGGIQITSGTVKNCTVARNATLRKTAENSGGGGINMLSALVQDCIIEENISGFWGGGLYLNGGATLRNCLIRNNFSGNWGGGALRVFGNNVNISSCTIVSNNAPVYGGGIYNSSSTYGYNVNIDNCIIYFNQCSGNPPSSNLFDNSASPSVVSYSNCCVAGFGLAAGIVMTGGITNQNPQFTDWPAGNYRLNKESPCVNAGVNRDWMTGAFDLDGHRRLDVFSGLVDIGCYEFLFSGTMITIP